MSDAVGTRLVPGGASAVHRPSSRADTASITSLLETRIARLLPKLTRADRAFAIAHVRAGLMAMVRDEAARIRGVMEEAMQSTGQAPGAPPVEPVEAIELLLPVLTEADLVYLLASPPSPNAAGAHAERPAILSLLTGASASVQETVLDALVGGKSRDPRATELSAQAGQSLGEIAAGYALEVLAQGENLPAPLRAEMTAQIDPTRPELEGDEEVLASVRALKTRCALTEAVLLEAAQRNEPRRVAAILAVASGVSLGAVDRVCWQRSAKALVALAWKSGFTMRAGVAAQSVLGQLSLANRLVPKQDGGFPLERAEMEWQIELLRAVRDMDASQAA